TFEDTGLPFGFSSSLWVFTKLLRVAVVFLRRRGIRLVIYLDDLLIVGASFQKCTTAVAQVITTLEYLGFLINFKNSETNPSQCIEYIGLITDSLAMSFRLTDKMMANISRLCKKALLTSAYKINNDNLDIIVSLDDASLVDLSWWIHEANFSNGEGLLSSRPDVYLSSDASRIGWDAVRLDIKTRGPWTPTELDQHTVPTPGIGSPRSNYSHIPNYSHMSGFPSYLVSHVMESFP
ncbi:Uncharacterized protein APZ42_008879, partial [Daphnia magna]